jgi:hypothetical protein
MFGSSMTHFIDVWIKYDTFYRCLDQVWHILCANILLKKEEIRWKLWALIKLYFVSTSITGADPGFQVRGGALKKIAPSGGRRENCWGISCEKSRFYAKKSYFFQLRREARKFLGISCEKSRFYAKKSYFFQL